MVDPLADGIVAPTEARAGERIVVSSELDPGAALAELFRQHGLRQFRHLLGMGRRAGLALAHQHPTRIAQHDRVVLVTADRANIDDAGIARRGLLQPDHLRRGRERIAGIDRLEEAPIGIAEIGDGIERDIRHRLAEDDMEHEQVVDRRRGIADRASEGVRGLHRKARAVERRIERCIAGPHRARRRMDDAVAEVEILEETSGTGLRARAGHASSPDRRRVCVATKGGGKPC